MKNFVNSLILTFENSVWMHSQVMKLIKYFATYLHHPDFYYKSFTLTDSGLQHNRLK